MDPTMQNNADVVREALKNAPEMRLWAREGALQALIKEGFIKGIPKKPWWRR